MSHEQSADIGELATALAKAQLELQPVKKDRTAKIRTNKGPDYSYNYADLASVLEACRPLAKHGLAVLQTTKTGGHQVTVYTTLMHSSGQWVRGELSLPAPGSDPKAVGSAITYARRYGLSAIVGLASEEDDDGQAAGREREQRPRERGNEGRRDQRPARTDMRRPTPPGAQHRQSEAHIDEQGRAELHDLDNKPRRPKSDEQGPWDDTVIDSRTPWATPEWYGMTLGECADWQDAAVKQAPVEVARELPEPAKSYARRAHKLVKQREKVGAA